jgi:hypothetical protein
MEEGKYPSSHSTVPIFHLMGEENRKALLKVTDQRHRLTERLTEYFPSPHS